MTWGKLVIVPNPGLYGFGKVPVHPDGLYRWAFNFWNYTVAWLR